MSPLSHSDPYSLAAALSMKEYAPLQRRLVLDFITAAAPVSAWEIADYLGIDGNSVRPRLRELEAAGEIERHGKGKTPSGRSCSLYRIRQKPAVLLQTRSFDAPELVVE